MLTRPAIGALAACLLFTAPASSQVTAKVKLEERPTLHGKLEATDGKLSVTTADGKRHGIAFDALEGIDVDTPKLFWNIEKLDNGELPAPWKQAAVGDLPHGGRAEVTGGKIVVETSSPPKEAGFDAFQMAFRPAPKGDFQFTCVVSRIDSYEDSTKAGVMLRDGLGIDARNVFLSLSHREPASLRDWKRQGGTTVQDRRSDIRPGRWLRIVRAGGKVTGYVSVNAGFWREIASVEDIFEGDVYACLVAQGQKPRRRWSATFDNIDLTTMEVAGEVRVAKPRITLVDGTVFQSEIASGSPTLLRLGGRNASRVVPLLSVASIEFYRPIPANQLHHLGGDRPGVLLANGDYFESKLVAIKDNSLATSSALFGKREFDLDFETNALVLRPKAAATAVRLPFTVETWAGSHFSGKRLRIEGDAIAIDTLRLRTQIIPLGELRRIVGE